MNDKEKIEKLRQEAKKFYSEKKWYELISVLKEFIYLCKGMSTDYVRELHAYFLLGCAYYTIQEYSCAIENFENEIKLNPEFADAYFFLGNVYNRIGDSYIRKDNDLAVENYLCAIKSYDLAIKYYKNNVNPNCPFAHFNRGTTYLNISGDGNAYAYAHAYDDFVKADELSPSLKFGFAPAYIANQIETALSLDEMKKKELFRLFCDVFVEVHNIKVDRFLRYKDGQQTAHYTGLDTMKKLLGSSPSAFRLYNADYMNDPEEGRTFFEVLENHGVDVKTMFHVNNEKTSSYSPAYIGSFVPVKQEHPDDTGTKDKLFLWRTYGKHDGDEAAGACLFFNYDKDYFIEKLSPQTSAMQQSFLLHKMSSMLGQDNSVTSSKQEPLKLELYKVSYQSDFNKGDTKQLIRALAEKLQAVHEFYRNSMDNDSDRPKVSNIVHELLDGVRFLFKADHYKEEQEVRVIQIHYAEEEEIHKSGMVKIDVDHLPPSFYMEAPSGWKPVEVILGPMARRISEWKSWLKKHNPDLKVKSSKISYGKKDR